MPVSLLPSAVSALLSHPHELAGRIKDLSVQFSSVAQ